jgi:L-2,4-diaminobutyrate decarboxylase
MTGTWDVDEFVVAAERTVRRLAEYVAASQRGDGPAVTALRPAALIEQLDLERWITDGGMDPDSFAEFLDRYLANSTRLHHPGYLAHMSASPDIGAALADLVHGVINNPMSIAEMGAPALAAELAVVRWMVTRAGWDPAAGGGVLTHGGSLANLTALLAARAAVAPQAWAEGVPDDLAVLAPAASHYSVRRAVGILGLGERAIVPLPTDRLDRVDVDRLPEALAAVQAAGRRPMALVAAACATGTGLYDDLAAIATFCREHGIWFHVDGAHGASALLSPAHRHLLDGVAAADSLTWDAHKMLRAGSVAAALLVRRRETLDAAFQQQASYLIYGGYDETTEVLGRQIECTKAPLGLRVLLNLAWRGEAGLGEYVASRYTAAHRAWRLIIRRDGFTSPFEPQSNVVCFRYRSADVVTVREKLLADGAFHLSSTELGGQRYLRLTIMAPSTDDEAIERMLDAVVVAAA